MLRVGGWLTTGYCAMLGVGGCHWVAPSPVVVLDAGESLALVLRSVGLNVV